MGRSARRPNPRTRENSNSRSSTASSRRTTTSRTRPNRGSRFQEVSVSFSSFDRSMLRRAIDSTIEAITRNPKQYMNRFGISSKDSVNRSVRSLSRTKDKLGL